MPHKPEDLSSILAPSVKSQVWWHMLIIPVLGMQKVEVPRGHWTDSLA